MVDFKIGGHMVIVDDFIIDDRLDRVNNIVIYSGCLTTRIDS